MSRLRLMPLLALLLLAAMGCGANLPEGQPGDSNGEEAPPGGLDDDREYEADPFEDPRIIAQAPLSEAAREIGQLAREQDLEGLAGMRFDHDAHAVVLHWKGPLPEPVASLVEQLRAEVGIEVVDVPYSERELVEEAGRIARLDPGEIGVTVTGSGVLPDFSGIRVTVLSEEYIPIAREAIQSPVRLEFVAGERERCSTTLAGFSAPWELVPGFDPVPTALDPVNAMGCSGGAAESITVILRNGDTETRHTHSFDTPSQVRLPLPAGTMAVIPKDLPLGEYAREVLVTYTDGETRTLDGMRDTVHLVEDRQLWPEQCRALGLPDECGTAQEVMASEG